MFDEQGYMVTGAVIDHKNYVMLPQTAEKYGFIWPPWHMEYFKDKAAKRKMANAETSASAKQLDA